MNYRRLGESGLESVPALPRHDEFRRPDRRGRLAAHHRRRPRRRHQLHRHGRTSTTPAARRRSSAGRSPAGATSGCWRRRSNGASAPGPNERGSSRKALMQAAAASLRRFGTDYIDIYYLHREDPATPLAESVRALADLQRAGMIRYFGALEPQGLAARRDLQSLRRARHRPAGREPALLQRDEPHAGDRAPAGLRVLWSGGGALQPARARRAERQICARTRRRRRAAAPAGRTRA